MVRHKNSLKDMFLSLSNACISYKALIAIQLYSDAFIRLSQRYLLFLVLVLRERAKLNVLN